MSNQDRNRKEDAPPDSFVEKSDNSSFSSSSAHSSFLLELNELADQVGGFIEYWGFKEIHGRIWTHLFTSDTPLDSTMLVKRLKVSKALVSFAVRDLLDHKVIEEVSKGPRGTVLFRANPDLLQVILGVLRTRERRMLARIHSAHRLLANLPSRTLKDGGLSLDRVKQVGELIATAEGALDAFISLSGDSPLFPAPDAPEDDKRNALSLQLKAMTLPTPKGK
jgi:DNA-binding transcriptional regulator GbsR (MarR family)